MRPARCATTAHSAAAASRPSELPSAVLKNHQSLSAIAAAATAAATAPGEPPGQRRRARQREQPAGARDDEPQRGRGAPASASGV